MGDCNGEVKADQHSLSNGIPTDIKPVSNGIDQCQDSNNVNTVIKKKPFRLPNRDVCCRCLVTVYPLEKVGPISGKVYHRECFQCAVCGTMLTVKTFFHNGKEVYCRSHQPK